MYFVLLVQALSFDTSIQDIYLSTLIRHFVEATILVFHFDSFQKQFVQQSFSNEK